MIKLGRRCGLFKFLSFVGLSLAVVFLLSGCDMKLLHPQGLVAIKETKLLITAVLLMLIVVIPVIILTIVFSWRYRASNTKATYAPNWSHSYLLESVWWTVPIILIGVLAVITWKSTHDLDPYKPLDVEGKPLVIQAVSLRWKWLFIYPEQHIATVNFVQFPAHRPIRFLVTSDAPMNSFMIQQLAGQIYAMNGMQTKLHLIADNTGDFNGRSVNYSGDGFGQMEFIARASSQKDFDGWVQSVKRSSNTLTTATYGKLALPSKDDPVAYYSFVEDDLFRNIMMKFMMPMHHTK